MERVALLPRRLESTPLPESCAFTLPGQVGALFIRRGEQAVYFAGLNAKAYNEERGINTKQVTAMLMGALLGWQSRFVDPDLYNDCGTFTPVPLGVMRVMHYCAVRGIEGQPGDALPEGLPQDVLDWIDVNRLRFVAGIKLRTKLLNLPGVWGGDEIGAHAQRRKHEALPPNFVARASGDIVEVVTSSGRRWHGRITGSSPLNDDLFLIRKVRAPTPAKNVARCLSRARRYQ